MNNVAASSRECSGLLECARRESTTILVNVRADLDGGDGGSSAAADANRSCLATSCCASPLLSPPTILFRKLLLALASPTPHRTALSNLWRST